MPTKIKLDMVCNDALPGYANITANSYWVAAYSHPKTGYFTFLTNSATAASHTVTSCEVSVSERTMTNNTHLKLQCNPAGCSRYQTGRSRRALAEQRRENNVIRHGCTELLMISSTIGIRILIVNTFSFGLFLLRCRKWSASYPCHKDNANISSRHEVAKIRS